MGPDNDHLTKESLLQLSKHFLIGPRNAQYLSPQIQNDNIGSISEFVRERIGGTLKDHIYYSVMVDELLACKNSDNLGAFKVLADYREESKCTRIVLTFKSYDS